MEVAAAGAQIGHETIRSGPLGSFKNGNLLNWVLSLANEDRHSWD